jgi:phenylpropionate dioxygenase-like ring-hydroxylating dioxygenase large terminal subunit
MLHPVSFYLSHLKIQVHKNEKACVAVYPCVEQNKILWFWPNADSRCKDILNEKRPPYIPELDDPSFTATMGTRDLLYGYHPCFSLLC